VPDCEATARPVAAASKKGAENSKNFGRGIDIKK